MDAYLKKTILAVLIFVFLYNLVCCDIIEGIKKRNIKKIAKNPAKLKEIAKNPTKLKEIAKVQNVIKVANQGKKNILNQKSNQNSKSNQNNNANSELIKQFKKQQDDFDFFKKRFDTVTNTLQTRISNNTLKNEELQRFSEEKGNKLQGNIDLLSSELANNNIDMSTQLTDVKNKLKSLKKNIDDYEENNIKVEKMLKNVNLQLDTKYIAKIK